MHFIDRSIAPQECIAGSICPPHRHCPFWRIPVVLLVALATGAIPAALAQAPFVEITNPGDLGSDATDFGASWGDFDADGDMDIFVTKASQGTNYVYRNDGTNHFTRMSAAGIGELAGDVGDTAVGLWADMDNDGDLDLYVLNWSTGASPQDDRLYLNDGTGIFTNATPPGLNAPAQNSNNGSLDDFDKDGFLDIFVATWPQSGSVGVDVLYKSMGATNFTTVPSINVPTIGIVGSWADYDGDGDSDLIVANWQNGGHSVIYQNQLSDSGTAEFVATNRFANGLFIPRAAGAAWGDCDNDGDLDLLMSHDFQGLYLLRNQGAGEYTQTVMSLTNNRGARGIAWVDTDNDGDLDILIDGTDASNADSDGYSLMENDGQGNFTEHYLADTPATATGIQRAPAIADYDNDGFMDVYTVFDPGPDRLWRNEGNSNHWLKVNLRGIQSNRSAIGAIVRVKATIGGTTTWQMRQVSAGGEAQYVQHDPRPNFGLGDTTMAEMLVIEWPSGTVQELANVAADQILRVAEPPRIKWDSPDTISWPASADAFELQSADQPDGPWTNATETVVLDGNRRKATLEPNSPAKFYRLHMSE